MEHQLPALANTSTGTRVAKAGGTNAVVGIGDSEGSWNGWSQLKADGLLTPKKSEAGSGAE